MSEDDSLLASLPPTLALAKLAAIIQSGNADAAFLRSLYVRPEIKKDMPLRVSLLVPQVNRKRRSLRDKFLAALEQAVTPVASIPGHLEQSDMAYTASLTWLLVQSGPSQTPAAADPEKYLVVARGVSMDRAKQLFTQFQIHATEFKVAIVAEADAAPLYLFDVRGSVERNSTLAGLLASNQLADCVVLSSYLEGGSWFFAPAGVFATQKGPPPDSQALDNFAIISRMLAESVVRTADGGPGSTTLVDTDHGVAILAEAGTRPPDEERYSLLPLAGIHFESDLSFTPGLARNVTFEVLDLADSASARKELANRIHEADGDVYRLELRPTRDRDLAEMSRERLSEEQIYLQDALADVEQDLANYDGLHKPRPLLLRFTQAQLPALAQVLTSFPIAVLRDGGLQYAFQATDRHPEGVHFLLVHPQRAARTELDPLIWPEDGTPPKRFWLDPQWARYYFSAGNPHFVFVPHGHVLFPPVHVWEHSDLDSRLRDAMRLFLRGADAGVLPEFSAPLYVCEVVNDASTRHEMIEIAVLDQDKFLPLQMQLGWINDNLHIQRQLGVERLVELSAKYMLEAEIDGAIRARAAAAREAFTAAAAETQVDILAATARLFEQVAGEIAQQLAAMQKRIEAARAEILDSTEQIRQATLSTTSTRTEMESVMQRLHGLVQAHAEMKGISQEISGLEKTTQDELRLFGESLKRLENAVTQTGQHREKVEADVTATIDRVQRTRDELRRKLAEL